MTQSDIQSGSDHLLVTGYGSNGYVVTGYELSCKIDIQNEERDDMIDWET